MRKKNRLYTANKWNQPLFADVDRTHQNIFDGLEGSSIARWDRLASNAYGANYGDSGYTLNDYMNSKGNNWFGLSKKNNLFSKGNIGTTMQGVGTAALNVGDQVNTGDPRGLFDTLDPVYHIAGGRESGVGNALSDTGVTLAKSGNPWLMLAGAGLKVVGGLTNAAFGVKEYKNNVETIKANSALARMTGKAFGNVSNENDFWNLASNLGSQSNFKWNDLYKNGWLTKKGKKKGNALIADDNSAMAYQTHNMVKAAEDIDSKMDEIAFANSYAFGGPLGVSMFGNTGMGAIDYGFMSDYLTAKNRQAENKNTASNPFAGVANNFFPDGGSIHIKHPGRLTKLKERTGKTEAELWAEGRPEVRKMITFARNARAWSKANGGKIHRNSVEIPNFFDFGGDKEDALPGYGGGSFSGAGQGNGFVVEENTYKGAKNFNDAFDKAVKEGRQYFMFQGKKYNTKKEENPIREFNNRWVGERRMPNEKRSGYGVDYGPIGGSLANLPVVRDTYTGTPERPPQLEYNPDAYDIFYHRFTMPTMSSERHKIVPGRPVRWEGDKLVYAFGGDVQTNSADFSTGLTHISAGGSHEESPYDGVQLGVDSEGKPNLVEEGEVIFNDYVFSDRITIDDETKKKFHFPKKRDITYAEAAKKLEKEISERPNDPISEASFNAQMQQLEEQQERQKQEMEAARAREAFEALSPEEQAGVMRYAQQQEQAAQEQAMQQEAMAQQAQMQQPTPEEIAMAEQQQMGQPEVMEQEPIMAYGGRVNRFDDGGATNKLLNLLDIHTKEDFEDFLREIKLLDDESRYKLWEDDNTINPNTLKWLLNHEDFRNKVIKDNPALADAISKGYDFGAYSPEAGSVTFDDDRGNWDAQTVQGWWGSNDPAWKQVIAAHPELTEETNLTKEQLADYLRNTEAFQKGTKWLQDSEDNRLAYLQRIINNPNAPKRAKEYAMRYADANGWKQGAAKDYETIFNNPSGRAANPGTYWKTPIEAVRGNQTGNLVINDDGTIESIVGDVPKDWTSAGSYMWASPENDYSYNYYKRPTASATDEAAKKDENAKASTDDDWEVTPNYKNDKLRYAGIFGPAVGLGMQMLGIGKPNTGAFDNILEGYDRSGAALADYQPIGNYLRYNPMDIWFEQNRLNANARATDRAILNSGSNQGAKAAALLANGYNTQTASGDLYRKGLEYNDALRQQVAGFNRGTDQFNAEAYNRTALQNAGILNDQRRYRAQLGMQAAAQKADLDAGWYNGIYGNVAGLFKGIGDIGRENAQHNMIAEMAADGIFGSMSPRTNTGRRGKYLTFTKKACGGKLNKKKGGK